MLCFFFGLVYYLSQQPAMNYWWIRSLKKAWQNQQDVEPQWNLLF